MWRLAIDVAALAAVPAVEKCLRLATYGEVKGTVYLEGRKRIKDGVREKALKPWVKNFGGEDFAVDGIEA